MTFVVQNEYVNVTPDVHCTASARAYENYSCRISQPQLC